MDKCEKCGRDNPSETHRYWCSPARDIPNEKESQCEKSQIHENDKNRKVPEVYLEEST